VSLEHLGRNKARLVVEDDAPEGFKDLSHAFELASWVPWGGIGERPDTPWIG
jgi:hypothetical protein